MKPALPLTAIVLSAVSCPAFAQEPPSHEDRVTQAFAALDNDFERNWAYTESSTEEGRTWVGRYDPRLPAGGRWSLSSVDGRTPTARERDDWLADRVETEPRDDEHSADAGIVTRGSLVLLAEDDASWLFGFTPAAEGDEESRKFLAEVDGTLRIRKDGTWLEEFHLANESPITPATGVKISRFETLLSFGLAGPGGPVVPLAVDVHVKGRAFLAIGFDEQEQVRYSDYELVVPGAATVTAEEVVPDR